MTITLSKWMSCLWIQSVRKMVYELCPSSYLAPAKFFGFLHDVNFYPFGPTPSPITVREVSLIPSDVMCVIVSFNSNVTEVS